MNGWMDGWSEGEREGGMDAWREGGGGREGCQKCSSHFQPWHCHPTTSTKQKVLQGHPLNCWSRTPVPPVTSLTAVVNKHVQ